MKTWNIIGDSYSVFIILQRPKLSTMQSFEVLEKYTNSTVKQIQYIQ